MKIGKSDLVDIDCIDQSVEIDDTLVSFIDFHRFPSPTDKNHLIATDFYRLTTPSILAAHLY